MNRVLLTIAATVLVLLLGVWLLVSSGFYDVAADQPHMAWTQALLNSLRVHSIEAHAREVQVPPLDGAARIAEGAEHYVAMCTGCHLAPGMADTEMRQGLLPKPPNLAEEVLPDSAQVFWVIKHGIKATAMPAWGKTHDDEEIWNLVAFVQQLHQMSPAQYRAATGGDEGAAVLEQAHEDHPHEHNGAHEHHDY